MIKWTPKLLQKKELQNELKLKAIDVSNFVSIIRSLKTVISWIAVYSKVINASCDKDNGWLMNDGTIVQWQFRTMTVQINESVEQWQFL